jgi:preprotein translocase subunit Sec61beta
MIMTHSLLTLYISTFSSIFVVVILYTFQHIQATQRRAAQRLAGGAAAGGGGGGRVAGAGNNILQFYTDDSPGLQVGPTTVLVASLSFVGFVVLLHILGKFRS